MLDINHFKAINDNPGHQCGDVVLKQVAQIIQPHLKRPADGVCRYDGEEFMVILPETAAEGACTLAEIIRQGLAVLVGLADTALYAAETGGRNQVRLGEDDADHISGCPSLG
jgi:PleD family two-component response regulator